MIKSFTNIVRKRVVKVSAKLGRPVKGSQPMDKQMVVRMTEKMHADISNYAEENGIGKMEVVRKAVKEFFDK